MKRFVSSLLLSIVMTATTAQAAELKAQSQTGDARIVLSTSSTLKQGKNTLLLSLKDKMGKPLVTKALKVETTMSAQEMDAMGMKSMGEGVAKTEVSPGKTPGTYTVKTTLPFGGTWQIKASLQRPPASAIFTAAVK